MKNKFFNSANILCFGILMLFIALAQGAHAATFTAKTSGNWNNAATWTKTGTGGGTTPATGDIVVIDGNGALVGTVYYTVTVTTTGAACASIQLGNADKGSGTLTFSTSTTSSLAVSGTITVGATASSSFTDAGFLTMTSLSTLTAGSIINGSIHNGTITMVSGASLTTGSLANSATGDGVIDMSAGGTLTVNSMADGSGGGTSTYTFSAGTVIYGTSSSTSGNILATSYNNLTTVGGTYSIIGTTTVNGTLTVTSGTLAASTLLNIEGNFVNNATFTGTATFNGSTAQTIGGTGAFTFPNLTINNGAGVTLTQAVTVSGTLTLTSGKLILGNNKLTIGSSGTITGTFSSSNFIQTNGTGVVEMRVNNTSVTFPIGDGYNPITLTTTYDATFDVSIADLTGVKDANGHTITAHAVNAVWTITTLPGFGSSKNISVLPQWGSSDEKTPFDRTHCFVSSSTSKTSGWVSSQPATAALGINPWAIQSGNILMENNKTYYISVGDNASALPVTLVSFNANFENNLVNLNWATASEINNNYFNVQRSIDGQTWATIAKVEGHGNSLVTQNYFTSDNLAGIIPAGTLYYRLEQVDFNGANAYSMVRSVTLSSAPAVTINTFPNPTTNTLEVTWNSQDNGNAMLKLVNMAGQTIYTENVTGLGMMHKQVDMGTYPTGTYFLQIATGNNLSSQKVIKK